MTLDLNRVSRLVYHRPKCSDFPSGRTVVALIVTSFHASGMIIDRPYTGQVIIYTKSDNIFQISSSSSSSSRSHIFQISMVKLIFKEFCFYNFIVSKGIKFDMGSVWLIVVVTSYPASRGIIDWSFTGQVFNIHKQFITFFK